MPPSHLFSFRIDIAAAIWKCIVEYINILTASTNIDLKAFTKKTDVFDGHIIGANAIKAKIFV